jgi:hypothetical protein
MITVPVELGDGVDAAKSVGALDVDKEPLVEVSLPGGGKFSGGLPPFSIVSRRYWVSRSNRS